MLLHAVSVELVAPENGALFDPVPPCVREFLAKFDERGEKPPRPPRTEAEKEQERKQNEAYEAWVKAGRDKAHRVKPYEDRYNFYIPNAPTAELLKRAEEEEKTWRPFRWRIEGAVTEVAMEFSTTADFAKPVRQTVSLGKQNAAPLSGRASYLFLEQDYWWRVTVRTEDGESVASAPRRFRTVATPPRMIGPPSANMRDLGGGTNAEGRVVRQGLLYRGQAIGARATNESLRHHYGEMLGIRTELDLRGKSERDERRAQWGEGELADVIGANHVFYTIIPYHLYYPANLPPLRDAFALLADKANYPVYFHCAVGSDRTGTLGFLIGAVLGRSDKELIDDYELPSFNQNLRRFRYSRKAAGMLKDLGKLGSTYREAVPVYLLKIGVTQEQIDAIREIMLEPARRPDP